jgi:hypothetical protein
MYGHAVFYKLKNAATRKHVHRSLFTSILNANTECYVQVVFVFFFFFFVSIV